MSTSTRSRIVTETPESVRGIGRFVVSGPGRSGTGYISAVLTLAGIPTGHESVYGPGEALGRVAVDWRGYVGDASWLAAPLAPALRAGGIRVYHQIRNPIATIRSMVKIGLFHPGHDELHRDVLEVARVFAPHVFELGRALDRACSFWLAWWDLLEPVADRRWRLEDVDAELVAELARDVGLDPAHLRIGRALAAVRTDVNTRPGRGPSLRWEDLDRFPRLIEIADELGYLGAT